MNNDEEVMELLRIAHMDLPLEERRKLADNIKAIKNKVRDNQQSSKNTGIPGKRS